MKNLLITILFATTMFACRVTLVPAKDPAQIQNIQNIQADINSLYNRIASSSDRRYTTYLPAYTPIETEIAATLSFDQARPHASNIAHQVSLLQKSFLEYEGEHKAKGSMSAGEAMVYKSYLNSFIKTILNSENTLK